MSDQRYTDALLANGRLREERDRLREALELAKADIEEWREERDRLKALISAVAFAHDHSDYTECTRLLKEVTT